MAAPTFVSYTDLGSPYGPWGSSNSAFLSWNVGDLILIIQGTGAASHTFATPTTAGNTFTIQKFTSGALMVSTALSTCVTVTSASSQTVNVFGPGTTDWNASFWIWRAHGGVGNTAEQHTTTQSVAMNVSLHSAICWAGFDWQGATTTGTSPVPTPTNTRQVARDSIVYSQYIYDVTDQASAGSVSWGISGNPSAGPFSLVIGEVLASGPSSRPSWGRVKI